MRRLAPSIAGILLVCALLGGAYSTVWAQTSRTAPLPVTSVARTRLFQKQRDDLPPPKTEPKSPIPLTPPAQPVPQPQPQPLPPPALALATPVDPVQAQILAQVKRAISFHAAETMTPKAAQELIRQRAKAGVERRATFRPFRLGRSHALRPTLHPRHQSSPRSAQAIIITPGDTNSCRGRVRAKCESTLAH